MASMQNRASSNPLDWRAGCTRAAAECPRKKRFSAPLRSPGNKKKSYEVAGKGSSYGSYGSGSVNVRLLRTTGIFGGFGAGRSERVGTVIPTLVDRCFYCFLACRIRTTLLQEICVRQARHRERGPVLDGRGGRAGRTAVSSGNCQFISRLS